MELRTERGRIAIVRENQNVVQWSIEAVAAGASDPPVMVSDQADPSLLHLAASSVTEFALQLLVLNAKFSDRTDLFRANGQATDDGCAAIEQCLNRLPFGDLHWPPFPTRLYGDDAILAEVDGLTWVWITTRDGEAFERVLKIAEDAGICWESLERPH